MDKSKLLSEEELRKQGLDDEEIETYYFAHNNKKKGKVTAPGPISFVFSLRVSSQLSKDVDQAAKRMNITPSELIRMAVQEFLAKDEESTATRLELLAKLYPLVEKDLEKMRQDDRAS